MTGQEPDKAANSPLPDQADWEERLKQARAQRAKVLAERERAAGNPAAPNRPHAPKRSSPSGELSFESKLKAARTAREKLLAERETPDVQAVVSDTAPLGPEITKAEPPDATCSQDAATARPDRPWFQRLPKRGLRYAAVGIAAVSVGWAVVLLPWQVHEPVDRTAAIAQLALPADLDLVVVAKNGSDDVLRGMVDADYELRATNFSIARSSVEYYNAQDMGAATALAGALNADLVDLRGLLPGQPPSRIFVYLSDPAD
ncbi:hypothetical protein [Paracoccus sp. C2R09]|nr:hypothetical protein [Paracoccus sp. C2R09]MBU2957910.1 hypothetical protein [Paracoccus sp. C2R09]